MKIKDMEGFPEKDRLPLELNPCFLEIHRKNTNISPFLNDFRNNILDQLGNLEIGLNEWKVWEILAERFNCKPNKEDCKKELCTHYFRCKLLIEALSNAEGLIEVKEKR